MVILHYFPTLRPEVGGPARAVVDLCAALAGRGHEVTLATCDDEGVPAHWRAVRSAGIPFHELLPRSMPGGVAFPPRAMRKVRSLVSAHDVVHVHGAWLPTNVQVCGAARRAGVPYFISARGMLDDWCVGQKAFKKRVYLRLIGRRWLDRATAVHLTAQAELEQASRHFRSQRGTVIPNLLDLAPYRELPGPGLAHQEFPPLGNGRPNILFLSRLHPKKRLESLLRSARLLKDAGRPVNLLIAGTGDDRYVNQLRHLAAELGLGTDEACFLGQVVGDVKLSLYQAADLFVLPTSQENFGFVFVESLACGTPVLTTTGVDIWSELESGGGARIVSGDPEPLALAIGVLLDDAEGLTRMGERGRDWVFQWLDRNRLLDRFEAMYRGEPEPTA